MVYRDITKSFFILSFQLIYLFIIFVSLYFLLFPGFNWRNKHYLDIYLTSLCKRNTSIFKFFFCYVSVAYHKSKYSIGVYVQVIPCLISSYLLRPSNQKFYLLLFQILINVFILRPRMFVDHNGFIQYNTTYFFPVFFWVLFCITTRKIFKGLFLVCSFYTYSIVCYDDLSPYRGASSLCFNTTIAFDDSLD